MRVGLTGGIGAGKSAVAAIFSELGAFVVDTDEIARDATAPRSDGLLAIARIWPQVVRDEVLDRAELAEVVFNDAAALERLNLLLHPHIARLALERERRAGPDQTIVHVVPLLFETGYDRIVDKSVVVVAPLERRIARVVQRDHTDGGRVGARIAAQLDPGVARQRADFAIENDGTFERLRRRARAVYEDLR